MRSLVILIPTVITGVLVSTALLGQDQGQTARQRGEGSGAATSNAPFDPHDMSGVWIIRQKNLEISADVPPMTSEGQMAFNNNKPSYGPRAIPPAEGNDPMGNCDPLGYPRTLFYGGNEPVQIVQTPGEVLQLWEIHSVWRQIWTDGRQLPTDPESPSWIGHSGTDSPAWMGYSVGKWDGDTFVVESTGFDERTWLDHFGDAHSDQMSLEERYRRVDHDTMELTMTLTDPKFYTKPWVSEVKTFKLVSPKVELHEMYCVPSEEQAFNKRIRDLAGKGVQSKP